MATTRILGAILAGGQSRRYGRDKRNAVVGGRLLIERAISALEQVVQDVVVVTSRQLPNGVVAPCIPDRFVDAGPLGGLHAALHTAVEFGSSSVLLLACDMPLMTPEVLRAVAVAADQGQAVAPVRDGGIEPLCAVYHTGTLEIAEQMLLGNDLSLHRFFREVGGIPIDLEALGMECGHVFFNVNEQADCIRADALLTGST
ncbi:MAG: molybdenum cofactor guanylyltransferase [Gemmatimonadetes bacterium]|nr:molybdenum cofactor guanylyltransferase [Gemmatimonadota bacterium]